MSKSKASKSKVPESQLKISTFFGRKAAVTKPTSKLFTNITTAPVNGSKKRELMSGHDHNAHLKQNQLQAKGKENISVICIDDDDDDDDNDIANESVKKSPTESFDNSCAIEAKSISLTNVETSLPQSPFTPTKSGNQLRSTSGNSPDIICDTPGEDTLLSSRPRKTFSSRSFLLSSDSLCAPPGKKQLQTSFKKRMGKTFQSISVQFNPTCTKFTGSETTGINIAEDISFSSECDNSDGNQSVSESSVLPKPDTIGLNTKESHTEKYNLGNANNAMPNLVQPFKNNLPDKNIQDIVLQEGRQWKEVNLDDILKPSEESRYNNESFNQDCLDSKEACAKNLLKSNTTASSSGKLTVLKTKSWSKSDNNYSTLQVQNKPAAKLLDALENPEMKADQTETSKWISRQLMQHITDSSSLVNMGEVTVAGDNQKDTTPKKVYEGSRLTIKRQAKPGSSPSSKRLPQGGTASLKDEKIPGKDLNMASCLHIDHVKRALCLEDGIHEVELNGSSERRSKFTKERAYQFGLKEKDTSSTGDNKVTLKNDKDLAELLNSISPSIVNHAKHSSMAIKKPSKLSIATEGKKNLVEKNKMDILDMQKTRNLNASDMEMLDQLFGPEEDSEPISTQVRLTDTQTKVLGNLEKQQRLFNNEVIVIDDLESPTKQDCIEIFDSMEVVIAPEDDGIVRSLPANDMDHKRKKGDNPRKDETKTSQETEPTDIGCESNSVDPLADRIKAVGFESLEMLDNSTLSMNSPAVGINSSAADLGQEDVQLKLLDDSHIIKPDSEEFNDEMLHFSLDVFDDCDKNLQTSKSTKFNGILQKEFRFTDLWQRFTVTDVSYDSKNDEKVLSLSSDKTNQQCSCVLRGFWVDTIVAKNDVVNIIGEFENGKCVLTDCNGLLIVNPDLLLSGTLVVSSLFCARKSVLKEKFQGIEKGNIQMLYGSIIHSLFQQTVKENIRDEKKIIAKAHSLLNSSKFLHEMYGQGVEEAKVMEEITSYIPSLITWLKKHTEFTWPTNLGKQSANVVVKEIHDIEENFWSPRFGLKGKIDMTVKAELKSANTSSEIKILPLELKTGKASFSSEHKGQVTLYSMMYSDRRREPDEGILLYLKNGDMQIVPAKPESKSGLIQLRNQLAHYLNSQVQRETSENNSVTYSLGQLPQPINNPRFCGNCSQLLNCSIYQRSVEQCAPSKDESMNSLLDEAISHLDSEELAYYKYWMLCLDLEMIKKNPKEIWCRSSSEREQNGDCIQNLSITDSTLGIPDSQFLTEGEGCSLTFTRESGPPLNAVGFTSGDLVVVSSEDGRYIALTTGFIRNITSSCVEVVVDRDYLHDTSHFENLKFRLDRNDGLSTSGYLYTNMSRLMESSAKMKRLRELVIKKSQPHFELKLSKSLVERVKPIFKLLNKPQRSAILKVLMAKDYVLIKGYPGSGKTSTIVALVKILHLSGQSVLLTSFTHSAVDNILLKLKQDGVRFLRLGRKGRIHAQILPYSAEVVSTSPDVKDVQKLKSLYDSYDIVATSCLGINHPIFNHRKFDVCIVDEASQILQPACMGPIFYSSKFVLVGDAKQLPPIVQSKEAKNLNMDESLFSRLENCGATFDLNLQYRMNRVIMELSNKLVYRGKLECGSLEVANKTLDIDLEEIQTSPNWMKEALSPLLEKSVIFLDTQQMLSTETVDGKGLINTGEADLVINLLLTLIRANVNPEVIGVIAPYRSQVKLIQFKVQGYENLGEVEVNTVDQYQGRDKNVIIVSFVRTKNDNMGELLKDLRRLNVAMTRAKHKLIFVGHVKTLRSYEHMAQIISHLEESKNILSVPEVFQV
ncbi:DNA replication ATP-dependent helicase/nuclease DNA2 [Biomphalaria glabrata]|uniref:DNA replication ATP-dependent helicase/nuclease DNA2 n=2 Tax=Biomphalaria glabrata TaxID=6526 RepID=A0A9W2YJW3_BIOGL|nr:DNA replication ATP-dependent helicase/nuclease DNA2-like [Biomphalaria glabrata]XP_055862985.1 DNA replication ATP-dependent helicase/nuclease DNA2-like [Biomphalaria glabrata]KAI8753816.1 DNA replication ATP-dependent helicase/nuclease DNA2-like [Biomphalaria glabrata]